MDLDGEVEEGGGEGEAGELGSCQYGKPAVGANIQSPRRSPFRARPECRAE